MYQEFDFRCSRHGSYKASIVSFYFKIAVALLFRSVVRFRRSEPPIKQGLQVYLLGARYSKDFKGGDGDFGCIEVSSRGDCSSRVKLAMALIYLAATVGCIVEKGRVRAFVERFCGRQLMLIFAGATHVILENDVCPVEVALCRQLDRKFSTVVFQHGVMTCETIGNTRDGQYADYFVPLNPSSGHQLSSWVRSRIVLPAESEHVSRDFIFRRDKPIATVVWLGQPFYKYDAQLHELYLDRLATVVRELERHGVEVKYKPHPAEGKLNDIRIERVAFGLDSPYYKGKLCLSFSSTAIYDINVYGAFAVQVDDLSQGNMETYGLCSSFKLRDLIRAIGSGALITSYQLPIGKLEGLRLVLSQSSGLPAEFKLLD